MFRSPPRFGTRVILALPFSADERTEKALLLSDGTWDSATDILDRKLYRDTSGRTRTERLDPTNGDSGTGTTAWMSTVEIDDPVAGFHYVLDPRRGVAHRFKSPQVIVSAVSDGHLPPVTSAATQAESLGTKAFDNESLPAVGWRYTSTVSTREVWTAPDLKVEVFSKSTIVDPRSKAGVQITMKVSNVKRAEPDPGLFGLPDNFKVVDESGPIEIKYSAP